MLVSELAKLLNAEVLTPDLPDRAVDCGYTCDLLSWVMAKGRANCAWVTVQTHLNVIAVASLHEMSCVIFPEDIQAEAPSVAKAAEEGIFVLRSQKTAYEIAGLMVGAGIASV